MTTLTEQINHPSRDIITPRTLLILWLLCLVILLAFLGTPAVQRTQEARVLETARQMMHQPLRGWLVPTLNEELRLHKPPLPYWLAAIAFHIGGVSEFVGRFPTVLLGWLTIAVTYFIGKNFFNQITGVLSAVVLASSYFFFRFSRLAETDAPTMLFVTLAIYAIWRAITCSHERKFAGACFLAAIGIGLAALSKGPPALFPLIFLALALISRQWGRHSCPPLAGGEIGSTSTSIRDRQECLSHWFVIPTAIVVALLIGATWWLYIIHTVGYSTFRSELAVTVEGEDHPGSPLLYVPMLLLGTLPWAPIFILGVINAIRRWRNQNVRLLLSWFIAIALPLCFTGNKQPHYLLPLIPCAAVITGRWLANVLPRMFLPLIPFALIVLAVMTLALGWWYPNYLSRKSDDPRQIARVIKKKFDDAPCVFFGYEHSLPLCFSMRQEIPNAVDAKDLERRKVPGLLVICKVRDKEPQLPPEFHQVLDFKLEEHRLEVYRAD